MHGAGLFTAVGADRPPPLRAQQQPPGPPWVLAVVATPTDWVLWLHACAPSSAPVVHHASSRSLASAGSKLYTTSRTRRTPPGFSMLRSQRHRLPKVREVMHTGCRRSRQASPHVRRSGNRLRRPRRCRGHRPCPAIAAASAARRRRRQHERSVRRHTARTGPYPLRPRMSRVPWNFGGGPLIVRPR